MVTALLVMASFLLGVAVTVFVGWFVSERFARKPTTKEVKEYEAKAHEQEEAWAEGFDSVAAYRKWKEDGGDKA